MSAPTLKQAAEAIQTLKDFGLQPQAFECTIERLEEIAKMCFEELVRSDQPIITVRPDSELLNLGRSYQLEYFSGVPLVTK